MDRTNTVAPPVGLYYLFTAHTHTRKKLDPANSVMAPIYMQTEKRRQPKKVAIRTIVHQQYHVCYNTSLSHRVIHAPRITHKKLTGTPLQSAPPTVVTHNLLPQKCRPGSSVPRIIQRNNTRPQTWLTSRFCKSNVAGGAYRNKTASSKDT